MKRKSQRSNVWDHRTQSVEEVGTKKKIIKCNLFHKFLEVFNTDSYSMPSQVYQPIPNTRLTNIFTNNHKDQCNMG